LKLKIPKPEMPKMPHFSLQTSSKTIAGKEISYPSGIGVEWRAKGAIFTRPTIFGMNNGKLQGAGEAGIEAALPLNEKNLSAIGKGIADTMPQTNGDIVVHVYVDSEELNTRLAPGMSKHINQNNKIGARGQGVIL
ncbi:hypothetical protein, partial [Salmonella enterica]|uniref:hypothetical protein n=1 Tax=Salmonella enterica TaxID=28901 RepID=UPI0037332132